MSMTQEKASPSGTAAAQPPAGKADAKAMAMTVNGQAVAFQPGDTILAACQRAGIAIPTLCHMEEFRPSGSCRYCVVEAEGRPALVPSCTYPAEPGLVLRTHSARVVEARRAIIGLLLSDHPGDCLSCARSGSCRLQELAAELDVRQARPREAHPHDELDVSGPSIVRDTSKCILCGRCVRVCDEVQYVAAIGFIGRGAETIVGTAFREGMNTGACVNCGQCTLVCPTGALTERRQVAEVAEALRNPAKTVVVQHAPSVSVSIGELAGLPPGTDTDGALVAALRRLGFRHVFDTSYSADLTIMEEAAEFVHRLKNQGRFPMFTSCSPAWIKFVETQYPEFIPNLSTCKSPQGMLGALIKHWWAKNRGLKPEDVYSVSIMPCTAKKFEAARPELSVKGVRDVDAVLTIRELASFFKQHNLDLAKLPPEKPESPFGERSTAGKLFGTTGGVMEAALRTAYYLVTGHDAAQLEFKPIRGMDGIKEFRVAVAGLDLGVAVAHTLSNARKLLEELRKGRKDLHFIEVMSCPGGCVGGGGQPLSTERAGIRIRQEKLYQIDSAEPAARRLCHRNEEIKRLYDEFLGAPLGHLSHELLHTHFRERSAAL